jgi:hypothetical protein
MAILRRPVRAFTGAMATGAALLTAVGLGTAPVSAATAPTWTIKPGGTITATASSALVQDTTNGAKISCSGTALTAKLKSGSKLAGQNAGSLSKFSLTKCGADGVFLGILAKHTPWHVSLSSYNAMTGVTTMVLTGIHLAVSQTRLGCTGVVDGTSATAGNGKIKLSYSNSTHKLTTFKTGGNLHLYRVSAGCLGVVNSGDAVTLSAVYAVSPAQRITSP